MRKYTPNLSNKLSRKELILVNNKKKSNFNILREYEVLAKPTKVFCPNNIDENSSDYYSITSHRHILTNRNEQKNYESNNILPKLKYKSSDVDYAESKKKNHDFSLRSSKGTFSIKNVDEKIDEMFKNLYSIDKIDKILLEQKKYESVIPDKENILKIQNKQKFRVIQTKILKSDLKHHNYSRNKEIPLHMSSLNNTCLTDNFLMKESVPRRRNKNSSINQLSTQLTNHKTISSLRKDTNNTNPTNLQPIENIITRCNQQLKTLNKTFKINKKKTVILDKKISKLFGKIFQSYKTRQESEFAKDVMSYLKEQGAFIYGEKSGTYHNNINLFK
jgi:hypothetical protein